jgi:hypothetical protein
MILSEFIQQQQDNLQKYSDEVQQLVKQDPANFSNLDLDYFDWFENYLVWLSEKSKESLRKEKSKSTMAEKVDKIYKATLDPVLREIGMKSLENGGDIDIILMSIAITETFTN